MKGRGVRPDGWRAKPSSSDLAALVKCELELVWTKDGKRPTAEVRERQRASGVGEVLHRQAQVSMETYHNRPRDPARTPEPAGSAASVQDKRCFVASAVYGPSARETDELRAWRDRELSGRPVGAWAVRVYYSLSPPLVRLMGRVPAMRPLARSVLDVVRWLIRRGGGGRSGRGGDEGGDGHRTPLT